MKRFIQSAVALLMLVSSAFAVQIKNGSVNQTVDVFIQDSSATDGSGLTAVAFGDLTCYYREGATGTLTQLTLATQTVGGAHTDGGFVLIDNTNAAGLYRLDLSDVMVDGGSYVTIYLKGATNMAPVVMRVDLDTVEADVLEWKGAAADDPITLADINAEVDTALDTAIPGTPTASSINERVAAIDDLTQAAGSGDLAAMLVDTAEIGTAGAGLTNVTLNAASIDLVWDEVQSGHVTAGTFGLYLDTAVSNAGSPPSAAAISDAVWDEVQTGHVTAGTFGLYLDTEVSGAGSPPSAATIAGAVWDEVIFGAHDTANTAGALLDTPTDWATATGFATPTNITAGTITTVTTLTGHTAQTGDSFARLGAPTGASVSADIAAIDVLIDSIIAQVVTASGEPTGAPGVSASMQTKVNWLFKAFRNKVTQTATQYSLLDDDQTTVGTKATTADDGTTFSRTELETGP